MLARRLVVAVACSLLASNASAQIVGHSPGPRTRYEWNTNRPYGNNYYGGGGGGVYGNFGGFSFGAGVPYGGYNYYAPYAAYGAPVIVAPYGYYDGGYYNGYTAFPPSTAAYGYVPRPIFTAPFPPQPELPQVPVDPSEELGVRLNELRNRNRGPLPLADRLPVLKPSTPEQQQRSLRHMATADQQFKMSHYSGAALEYRRAIADAEDLPDNYFRLGFALAAQRRYDDAVQQWKYGLMLDQSWPTRGESLASLFGESNRLEKTAIVHRAADYVRLDPRDPDRIFLLGVLLHFDGDRDNAKTLFESATRVAGNEPYLMAFLSPSEGSNSAPATPPPAAAAPRRNSVPPVADESASSIPAPPPANINRSRTKSNLPPASLRPDDAQPIPPRQGPPTSQPAQEELPPPEKFPSLQTPKLPGPDSI